MPTRPGGDPGSIARDTQSAATSCSSRCPGCPFSGWSGKPGRKCLRSADGPRRDDWARPWRRGRHGGVTGANLVTAEAIGRYLGLAIDDAELDRDLQSAIADRRGAGQLAAASCSAGCRAPCGPSIATCGSHTRPVASSMPRASARRTPSGPASTISSERGTPPSQGSRTTSWRSPASASRSTTNTGALVHGAHRSVARRGRGGDRVAWARPSTHGEAGRRGPARPERSAARGSAANGSRRELRVGHPIRRRDVDRRASPDSTASRSGPVGGTLEAFLSMVYPDDMDRVAGRRVEALRGRAVQATTIASFAPDGHAGAAHARRGVRRTRRERGPDGGECWDVTELAEATQARERLLSLLQATIEATADGDPGRRSRSQGRDPQPAVSRACGGFRRSWWTAGDEDRAAASCDRWKIRRSSFAASSERYASAESEASIWSGAWTGASSSATRARSGSATRSSAGCGAPRRLRAGAAPARALFLSDATRLLASLDVEPALDAGSRTWRSPTSAMAARSTCSSDGGPRRLIAVSRDPTDADVARAAPDGPRRPLADLRSSGPSPTSGVPLLMKDGLVGAITCARPRPSQVHRDDLELAEELARRAALALETRACTAAPRRRCTRGTNFSPSRRTRSGAR